MALPQYIGWLERILVMLLLLINQPKGVDPSHISSPTDRINSIALLFRTTPGRSA